MEVIKGRLQISRTKADGKFLYQVRDLAKKEGLKGFYRGYLMGVANYIPYNAIYWSVYENTKKAMPGRSDTEKAILGAGLGVSMYSFSFMTHEVMPALSKLTGSQHVVQALFILWT